MVQECHGILQQYPKPAFFQNTLFSKVSPTFLTGPCSSLAVFSIAPCKGNVPMYCTCSLQDLVIIYIVWSSDITQSLAKSASASEHFGYSRKVLFATSFMACGKRKERRGKAQPPFLFCTSTRINGLRKTLRGVEMSNKYISSYKGVELRQILRQLGNERSMMTARKNW